MFIKSWLYKFFICSFCIFYFFIFFLLTISITIARKALTFLALKLIIYIILWHTAEHNKSQYWSISFHFLAWFFFCHIQQFLLYQFVSLPFDILATLKFQPPNKIKKKHTHKKRKAEAATAASEVAKATTTTNVCCVYKFCCVIAANRFLCIYLEMWYLKYHVYDAKIASNMFKS